MTDRDSRASATVAGAAKGLGIALGVERFGLLALRAPSLSIMVALALTVAAIFEIQRIE